MRNHYMVEIIENIIKLHDKLRPSYGDVSFIEKIAYLKTLEAKKIPFLKKLFVRKLVKEIVFTNMGVKKEDLFVNKDSFFVNQTEGSFFLDIFYYLQHVLRCVYMRLDESNTHLLIHYTPIATYSRTWNNFTKAARGIVVDLKNKRIVVHPYDKFFNYTEASETQEKNLPKGMIYEDAEKLDGSEGILYRDYKGKLRIITKGGFDTEQGKFATELLHNKFRKSLYTKDDEFCEMYWANLVEKYTLIFEIIYANNDLNRIVVDYGTEPDLRLIGMRNMKTLKTLSYKDVINWAKTLGFPSVNIETMTLEKMMEERKKRTNFEGWVRRYENGLYMKIKCEEYLEHHGARFGTSEKAVFSLVKEDKWDDFIANIPDEFKTLSSSMYDKITSFAKEKEELIFSSYKSIPEISDQKEFALYVNKNIDEKLRGYMFSLRLGREIDFIKANTWDKFRDLMKAS